jgi:hypothetical protein
VINHQASRGNQADARGQRRVPSDEATQPGMVPLVGRPGLALARLRRRVSTRTRFEIAPGRQVGAVPAGQGATPCVKVEAEFGPVITTRSYAREPYRC